MRTHAVLSAFLASLSCGASEYGPFTEFTHIPGPNPVLVPGTEGEWDDGVIESAHMLKDHDTYYFYYHGTGSGQGYQLGVATAGHPMGPWTKHEENPVLRLGAEGTWDSIHVACAFIVKEATERYYMFYSGYGPTEPDPVWSIGLATASSPLGPWEKHPGNPILEDCGYVGGVVPFEGKYHLYTEHPIGSTGDDYGPISLATADRPEGPWEIHDDGPVLRQGEWGDWDDGGMSEAGVFLRGGVFHMLYGGAKLHPTRILSRESIGYAYSLDGINFTKHPGNPVAPREAFPDGAAFAEVHAYYEPPFVYCYHTLRYNSQFGVEHLGVEALATQRPFSLSMPVLTDVSLPPGERTALDDCPPISLGPVERCALTVECTYGGDAAEGLLIHLRASQHGLTFDTEDLHTFALPCRPGETVRQTFDVDCSAMFCKAIVENPDPAGTVAAITIRATLSGS